MKQAECTRQWCNWKNCNQPPLSTKQIETRAQQATAEAGGQGRGVRLGGGGPPAKRRGRRARRRWLGRRGRHSRAPRAQSSARSPPRLRQGQAETRRVRKPPRRVQAN
eukprot:1239077-Pleurochrysis_carterae.AAC.3